MTKTLVVLKLLVLCCLTVSCNYSWVRVPTGAMQPTIKVNANIISDETAYPPGKAIERFDIVIHKAPIDDEMRKLGLKEDARFVFRVIAFGGEKVEIKKGKVFVNSKLLEEPFKKVSSDDNFALVIVPDNEFFLLGDNRPESNDSRYWKPATIKRENIIGKIVKIF